MVNVEDILTYSGCKTDIAINYSLLTLIAIVIPTLTLAHPSQLRSTRTAIYVAEFTVWTGFQIILCLVVGCTGISIIWNAFFGISLHSIAILRRARSLRIAECVVVVMCTVAWLA